MHPATSVIIFTVLSGAGFGGIALVGFGFPMAGTPISVFVISAISVGLAVAGLISSTFHLGHPERAWRAFTQWRSSWLSREAVAAVMTLFTYGLYALYWMFTGDRLLALGLLAAVCSIFTVFTTSMIYTQMKTVPHWHTPFTPLVFLLFSITTGLLLVSGANFSHWNDSHLMAALAMVMLLVSWAVKVWWWNRAGSINFDTTGSSVASATGLGKIGKVRLLDRPHTGPNYLTREMVHVIGRKHATRLRALAMILGGLVPLALSALVLADAIDGFALLIAAVFMIFGLLAERWLFFAEARHSVSLYY